MKHSKVMLLIISGLLLISIAGLCEASQEYPAEWDNYWNYSDNALFWGLSSACCFLAALPFIIGLLIGIWVYKDAEKRGKSGVLWLLIVWLIPFPIGLIIWLIVRPPIQGPQTTINQTIQTGPQQQSSERRCPGCGRVIPDDARVCPYCGKKFEE
jgi:ABC-type spermidine/putrescine transport system permease subunit I